VGIIETEQVCTRNYGFEKVEFLVVRLRHKEAWL
jgi:hypothetical protein